MAVRDVLLNSFSPSSAISAPIFLLPNSHLPVFAHKKATCRSKWLISLLFSNLKCCDWLIFDFIPHKGCQSYDHSNRAKCRLDHKRNPTTNQKTTPSKAFINSFCCLLITHPSFDIIISKLYHKSIKDEDFRSPKMCFFALKLQNHLKCLKRSHHFPRYMRAISFSRYPICSPINTNHAKSISSGSSSSIPSAWSSRFLI